MSQSWWLTQHNQHHRTPNDLDDDPHTLMPVLAFSEEKASCKRGIMRWLVGYQAFYYVPMLMLEGLGIRLASIQFLIEERKARQYLPDLSLMALHFVLYFGLLFYALNPWQVLAFALVHQGLFGLYYGLVFAPNHKGMLILDKDKPLDFVRTQVLTTRNVKPNFLVDLMYGGLNYQIEHHLFTMMPRKNLGKARPIVKEFCRQQGIPLLRNRNAPVLPGDSQPHAPGFVRSQNRLETAGQDGRRQSRSRQFRRHRRRLEGIQLIKFEGSFTGPSEEAAGVNRWSEESDSAEDISPATPAMIVGCR